MAFISSFKVKRGPLVKSWGDPTPATKEDVAVYINDVEVEVESVNPYTGEIFLADPVESQDPGDISVEVDYYWLASPIFPLSGLNVEGLSLNTFSVPRAVPQSPAFGSGAPDNIGAMDTSVFPYGVFLGPTEAQKPISIGHRFIGFDSAYTSSLNNPVSMVLNQNPNHNPLYLSRENSPFSLSYEAQQNPNQTWTILGSDTGSTLDGVHTQIFEGLSFYYKPESFNSQDFVYMSCRFKVEDYLLNDISTGISFGFHNNKDLYFVNLLEIQGVKLVGFLIDNESLIRQDSYLVGPYVSSNIIAENQFILSEAVVGLQEGSRFIVLSGNQEGVYTIESIEGLIVTIEETFPANYRLFGNKTITVCPEIDWTNPTSFRLYSDREGASLYVSGSVSGSFSISNKPNTTLKNLPLDSSFFWGALDNNNQGKVLWSFVKYGVTPRYFYDTQSSVSVSSINQWDQRGQALVEGDTIQGLSYEFKREDPFLRPENLFKLQATYQAPFQTRPEILNIENGSKNIRLGALTYVEDAGNPYRRLFNMPVVSTFETDFEYINNINFDRFVLSEDSGSATLVYTLDGLDSLDADNRFFEICFKSSSQNVPFSFNMSVNGKSVGFGFNGPELDLKTNSTVLESYSITWDVAEKNTYRLVVNSEDETIVLKVNDAVLTPLASYGDLENTVQDNNTCEVVLGGVDSVIDIYWSAFGASAISDCKRTFGVLTKAGDGSSLDHWEIPRTDSSSNANSSQSGPAIEEMDWTSSCEFFLQIDPEWGLTFFRPDLDLPPYYEPEDGRGTGFSSQNLIPSAGWINVETKNLPSTKERGIKYGVLSGYGDSCYAEQTWSVAYQIKPEDFIEPRIPAPMILNQANVISSGENLIDPTPEVYALEVLNNREVSFVPAHVFAKTVYKVIDGSVVYTEDMFSFDPHLQKITLGLDLDGNPYTFTNTNVEVVFESDRPTTTYLQDTTFWDSITKLNEGTPSFEKSQSLEITSNLSVNGILYPISDTEDDSGLVLSSSEIALKHTFEGLYESLEFFEVDNGGSRGLISWPREATSLDSAKNEWDAESGETIYDSEGEETGLVGTPQGGHVLAFSGYMENIPNGVFLEDSTTGFGFLFASGGRFVGPEIEDETIVAVNNPLGGLLNNALLSNGSESFVLVYSDSENPLEENGVINVTEDEPDVQLV